MMRRGRRGRGRLVGSVAIALAVGWYWRRRRDLDHRAPTVVAMPELDVEPLVAVAPVVDAAPVVAEPVVAGYDGRVRIEPSVRGDWSIRIDNPDRRAWRGTQLAPAAITVVAERYTVTLMDGDRRGQAATATVSFRYPRGMRAGRPESVQLNGKTSFS
jgi:hypothetical protein